MHGLAQVDRELVVFRSVLFLFLFLFFFFFGIIITIASGPQTAVKHGCLEFTVD